MVVPLEITHPTEKDYFKEIPFYNRPIEKPTIKRLKISIYQPNFLFLSN